MSIEVHPVTPDRWGDMVALFERPGPRGGTPTPGHCWCMGWRENQPWRLGWVAVAPIDEHIRPRVRLFRAPDDEAEVVFSITCFYVDPTARGGGLSSVLLDAAVDHARSRGATTVEGYPKRGVPPHAEKGASAEQSESFTGRRGMFEGHGFEPVRDVGARVVVRRSAT